MCIQTKDCLSSAVSISNKANAPHVRKNLREICGHMVTVAPIQPSFGPLLHAYASDEDIAKNEKRPIFKTLITTLRLISNPLD